MKQLPTCESTGSTDPAEDALLQHPWLPVTIDGVQLLSKPWFGETAYRILLTDMQSVWEEKIEAAAVEKRSQELNRRLRASAAAFFSHLCEVAQPCLSGGQQTGGEVQMSVNRQQDGDLTLRLKSELAGLPFYWEFRCSPAPVALVCAHLVRPLLAMSRLLQSHVEQLEDLLFRKDEEIQDYQENGATLSRGTEHDDRSFYLKRMTCYWKDPSRVSVAPLCRTSKPPPPPRAKFLRIALKPPANQSPGPNETFQGRNVAGTRQT
uniref:Non-homologous end-joining factor 1 n=1 Tax=Cyprinodon variegatus TaxID=28743 RepID=A0A3Q2CH33_CYPVA